MNANTKSTCHVQGQDDPKQYSNSTCGVHLMSSQPAASSSAAAERPAKRRRRQDGQLTGSELHASSTGAADLARHASGHISADETHAMPAIHEEAHAESSQQGHPASPRTAGVNPIDHIFQFHKASSHPAALAHPEPLLLLLQTPSLLMILLRVAICHISW